MTSSTRARSAAIGLATAGLLLGIGGVLHPRVDTSVGYEQGMAGMFESTAWTGAHTLTLAGYVLLAVSLALLVPVLEGRGRLIAWAAVAGAGIAAVESVPHLLAASEADALLAHGSTPLTDLHSTLQAVSTPAVGLSVAALALASTRGRVLVSRRIAAAVALFGGAAFALAGPVIAITENTALSPLFVGSAGLSIWMIVCGVRTARGLGGAETTGPLATAPAR
jgi:hypothetical protein